jgi:uncharacterized glyoxalase superfamily protein PhnB
MQKLKNRSAPADAVLPHIVYQNVADALAWLTTTFGFIEHYRYGGPDGTVQGAQVHLGEAWMMLTSSRPGRGSRAQVGGWTQSLTVFVDDVDVQFERVKAAGGRIVEDLNVTMYGERQFAVEDCEGHHWLFSQHVRDVGPEEWGALVAGG